MGVLPYSTNCVVLIGMAVEQERAENDGLDGMERM